MTPSSRKLIAYVGSVTLNHIADPKLQRTVQSFCEKLEHQHPRVKKAEIKGSHLHKSHDDPQDPKPVISIRFKNKNDRVVSRGHVHEDGTWKVSYKGDLITSEGESSRADYTSLRRA